VAITLPNPVIRDTSVHSVTNAVSRRRPASVVKSTA
jgi:hypothetical protein